MEQKSDTLSPRLLEGWQKPASKRNLHINKATSTDFFMHAAKADFQSGTPAINPLPASTN
jgi:hypothetical protein